MWRNAARLIFGFRVRFENYFALSLQLQLFSHDFLDRRRIRLQRLHAVLQPLISLVEPRNVFLNFLRFLLRTPHRQHAVRPENVLKQQESEAQDQERVHIPMEKLAELLEETDRRIICLAVVAARDVRVGSVHFVIHAWASAPNFFEAAILAVSV